MCPKDKKEKRKNREGQDFTTKWDSREIPYVLFSSEFRDRRHGQSSAVPCMVLHRCSCQEPWLGLRSFVLPKEKFQACSFKISPKWGSNWLCTVNQTAWETESANTMLRVPFRVGRLFSEGARRVGVKVTPLPLESLNSPRGSLPAWDIFEQPGST